MRDLGQVRRLPHALYVDTFFATIAASQKWRLIFVRIPVVAGNWKMNGTKASVAALVGAVSEGLPQQRRSEVVLCAPYPYLGQVADQLAGSTVGVGAQNLSEHAEGAYTGEVSAAMLLDCGCRYVIVGHSERRSLYGESNRCVADKFAAAQAGGLIPVLCVGESLAERQAEQTLQVVESQLQAVLDVVGIDAFASAIIAYEPVWAIGTGLTAAPEQAQAVHAAIRAILAGENPEVAQAVRILYGGSVKAANAASLFACPDIDGGLIGGASLDAAEFLSICQAAE